jgi:hypothetical protein
VPDARPDRAQLERMNYFFGEKRQDALIPNQAGNLMDEPSFGLRVKHWKNVIVIKLSLLFFNNQVF